jgi:hypothetical protein
MSDLGSFMSIPKLFMSWDNFSIDLFISSTRLSKSWTNDAGLLTSYDDF